MFSEKDFPSFMNHHSLTTLSGGYLLEGETPNDAIERIIGSSVNKLKKPDLKEKFLEFAQKGWWCFPSPVWSNMGTERGLPISCNGSNIDDSVGSIAYTLAENMVLSKMGAGTSAYWGNVRERGGAIRNNGKSNGTFPFQKMYDEMINGTSQGKTRRGAMAAYMDIEHPDFWEFINIKNETSDIQDLLTGICVSEDYLNTIKEKKGEERKRWAAVLKSKIEKGIPYLFFKDNANRYKPLVYKKFNLDIKASNLCTEIMLPSTFDETFVCCLLSMNLSKYDEWKDTDAVYWAIWFLDSVMQEYIDKIEAIMKNKHSDIQSYFEATLLQRVLNFAKRHRALGLGVLGWHSYLQSHMIPFISEKANSLTNEIFSFMQNQSIRASRDLATHYGEPFYMKGTGMRNTTLMAVAPTVSNATIMGGVSPCIEPDSSNYFVKETAKGVIEVKNAALVGLLENKGLNNSTTWASILQKGGSVQHFNFLSPKEKEVFKTFVEIDQLEIVRQAALRQKYIDQGQSLNLKFPHDVELKYVNKVIYEASDLGLKSLYYQRSQSVMRELMNQNESVSCVSCDG